MWSDLLIVALIGGIVAVDTTAAWQVMICRPIVSGPFVGFALGDLQTGLVFGAMMELIWVGIVPVGAAIFPDSNVGSVVGTALAIQLHQDLASLPLAVLISFVYMIPVACIGGRTIVLMRRLNVTLVRRALASAEGSREEKVVFQNRMGVLHSFGRGFLFGGLIYLVGSFGLSKGWLLLSGFDSAHFDMGVIPLMALGGAIVLAIFGKKRTLGFLIIGLVAGVVLSLL